MHGLVILALLAQQSLTVERGVVVDGAFKPQPGDTMHRLQFWDCPLTATIETGPTDEGMTVGAGKCGGTEIFRVTMLVDGYRLEARLPHCFVAERHGFTLEGTTARPRGQRWVCGATGANRPEFFPVDGQPAITIEPKPAHFEVWAAPSCAVTATWAECRRGR